MKNVTICLYGAMILSLAGCETIDSLGNSMKSVKIPDLGLSKITAPSKPENPLLVGGQDNCPTVKALHDLAEITQFSDTKTFASTTMISKTILEKLSATCTRSANSVAVDMALDFKGTLGPVGIKDLDGQANYTYPYFLAVVTPDGKILAKDVFALSMVYENQQMTYYKQDKLRQVIPLVAGQDSTQFQIMIGFQLSEDELAYNRAKK